MSTQPSCRARTTGKVASSFSLPRIVVTTLQQQSGRIWVALPRNHPAKVPDAPRYYRALMNTRHDCVNIDRSLYFRTPGSPPGVPAATALKETSKESAIPVPEGVIVECPRTNRHCGLIRRDWWRLAPLYACAALTFLLTRGWSHCFCCGLGMLPCHKT